MRGYMLTVFALLGVALHHLVTILEAREGHLSHRVLLMVGFVGREERRVCGEREMNTGESKKHCCMSDFCHCTKIYSRHKIGLEFVQINIERTVKAERRSDGRDNLSNKTIKVRETGRNNTKLLLANVINGFVINLKRCNESHGLFEYYLKDESLP